MAPFFHPTSILVLDDDPLFLESLHFQFSEDVSCQTFTRPDAALQHLRALAERRPGLDGFFEEPRRGNPEAMASPGDRLLVMRLTSLQAVLDDPGRLHQVAVAIIDYEMPKMTGVEFCRAIAHLPVKKVLLTGKASMETALAAFNEGVIDCFLQKQDPNLTAALRGEIRRLQKLYFAEIGAPVASAMALRRPNFMADASFLAHFDELLAKEEIVDYCVCGSPPGMHLRDADGNRSMLMVLDDGEAERLRRAAENAGAPASLVELLKSRSVHAWFPTRDGGYHPDYADCWEQFVWPAQSLAGEAGLSCSDVRCAPSAITHVPLSSSA